MEYNEEKFKLEELAIMNQISIEIAESYVCSCDLLYGYVCQYHKNPNMKKTLIKWNEMATNGDQCFVYGSTFQANKTKVKNY